MIKKINVCILVLLVIIANLAITNLFVSANSILSEVCGDNLNWDYDSVTQTLKISGTGKMYNFGMDGDYDFAPWYDTSNGYDKIPKDIKTVIIKGESISYIGTNAFCEIPSLESVVISSSVTEIGLGAFADSGVMDVYYSGTESQWNSIIIGDNNKPLTSATIHFNSNGPESDDDIYLDKEIVFNKDGVILYSNNTIDLPNGKTVNKPFVIKPEAGGEYSFILEKLISQSNNSFVEDNFGCFLMFELSLAPNTENTISSSKPADIYFHKDVLGTNIKEIEIAHIPDNEHRMEKYRFNKEGFNIEQGSGEYVNYWKIRVNSLSPFAVYSVPVIDANPGTKTIDYGQVLRLEADIPQGYDVHWYIGSKDTGKTGAVFDYDSKNSDGEVRAVLFKDGKVCKLDNEEICDKETVKVNAGFVKRLIAFFKYTLFRADRIVKN